MFRFRRAILTLHKLCIFAVSWAWRFANSTTLRTFFRKLPSLCLASNHLYPRRRLLQSCSRGSRGSTNSTGHRLSKIWFALLWFTLIALVLFILISKTTSRASVTRRYAYGCLSKSLWDRRQISSAKSRPSSFIQYLIPTGLIGSWYRREQWQREVATEDILTPQLVLNASLILPLSNTASSGEANNFWGNSLLLLSAIYIASRFIVPNVILKSMNSI